MNYKKGIIAFVVITLIIGSSFVLKNSLSPLFSANNNDSKEKSVSSQSKSNSGEDDTAVLEGQDDKEKQILKIAKDEQETNTNVKVSEPADAQAVKPFDKSKNNVETNVSRGEARTLSSENSIQPDVSSGDEKNTLTMVATAYTDDPEENYPWGGYPSYIGLPLERGIVAVDPDVIPMGTKIYIEGYGEGIAADQGGAIKGNKIDLFVDSKQEAYDWGIRTVEVTILD